MSRQPRQPDDGSFALVRAAAELGVALPSDYARAVVAQGLARGEEVRASSLAEGVVIRTVPRTRRRLPVLLGYADRRGQW
ncbi:MAG: hypothetical protein M0010_21840 [Actinomycetota bacterium]|jgi:hypothetical protein|nr:hypothetical protein [Actinomycetota bacterium]